jgi:hypothetical protein
VTESDRLRALWRCHFDQCNRVYAENAARHQRFMDTYAAGRHPTYEGALPIPPFPIELRGLRCGARNRRGQPCKQSNLGRNGRCKFHGGMSTGPKSAEGKARARANLLLRHVDRASASEPHADLTKPYAAPPARVVQTALPETTAPEPHGLLSNDSSGMAEADILASIAAVAAKRRRRR